MRVGLVTSWGVRCGHAEFASNIVENLPQVDFKPITDMTDSGILSSCDDVDIVHIIWSCGGWSPVTAQGIRSIKAKGKKVIISNQTTRPSGNHNDVMDSADIVITTEQTSDGFRYIPMGIPDNWVADTEPEKLVGTIGFPFMWKGLHDIAQAAALAGFNFLGVLPDYPLTVTENQKVRDMIYAVQPNTIYHVNWLSKEEIKRELGRCSVLVFAHRPYIGGMTYGVSSACRYGLATGRPCVFNKFDMYRDLFSYDDELYFVSTDSVENLSSVIIEAANGTKHPQRVLKDMSWKKCAGMFEDTYKELVQ